MAPPTDPNAKKTSPLEVVAEGDGIPRAVSMVGSVMAFLVPGVTLLFTWGLLAAFFTLGANGVMRRVDALVTSYVVGTVLVLVLAVLGSGLAARALATSGKMPLWMGVTLFTTLAVGVQCVGACCIFSGTGIALGIF